MNILRGAGIIYSDADPTSPPVDGNAELVFNVTTDTFWFWNRKLGKWKNLLSEIQIARAIDTNQVFTVNDDFELPPIAIVGEIVAVFNERGSRLTIKVTASTDNDVIGGRSIQDRRTGMFLAVNATTWSRIN